MVVCCESRAQALQDYPLCFSVDYKEPLIRFNFKYDTLLLGRGLLEGDNHHIFRRQCHKRDLDRVKSLMVDAELRWIGQDWFRHGQQHIRTGSGLCGLLRNVFPNVEEHTVIYTYSTDPVSCKYNLQHVALDAADALSRVGPRILVSSSSCEFFSEYFKARPLASFCWDFLNKLSCEPSSHVASVKTH
jgi:hypothetical protein